MKAIMAQAVAGASSGEQPGKEIMRGTVWGDPKYSEPGWAKLQAVSVLHEASSSGPIREFKVTIHYMYNTANGKLDDFKFVNPVSQACGDGKIVSV